MSYPVAYDITRLASRIFNATPNGIDRVDMAFARHFLENKDSKNIGLVYLGILGHRLIDNTGALAAIDTIEEHFEESAISANDTTFQDVHSWLTQSNTTKQVQPHRFSKSRKPSYLKAARWVFKHGATARHSLVNNLAQNARYICVSQFPLSINGAYNWLAKRPDLKPVFFIHDLLPLEYPEYFRDTEFARHQRRIKNLADYGAGAIVSTEVVKKSLSNYLDQLGRKDFPILIAPMPIAPTFFEPEQNNASISTPPYFVQCGTLEPRKNHLMLLNVWRELVARYGTNAPKLVLVGARGWENENIIDMLERSPSLHGHVLEVSGLATPNLKRLLKGARALLMPSFAEGFGLPLAEALALGVPVIASDIPVFHEIAAKAFTPISPIDGEGWLSAIMARCEKHPDANKNLAVSNFTKPATGTFFHSVDDFLAGL